MFLKDIIQLDMNKCGLSLKIYNISSDNKCDWSLNV